MKKSCRRVMRKEDMDLGYCPAFYDRKQVGRITLCGLGYEVRHGIPQEQCPKPTSMKKYEEIKEKKDG